MPVRTAWRMHSRFGTGNIPGIAASTRLTWVLGSAPNAVAAPEKSLDAVAVICAWTSTPMTTSHSRVPRLILYGAFIDFSVDSFCLARAVPKCAGVLELEAAFQTDSANP